MIKFTHPLKITALVLAGAAVVGTSSFAIAAANAPEPLTRAQAQTMAERQFDRLDVNKDGKIDTADKTARQNARFDAIDTNKNGQISREEFAAGHRGGRDQANREHGDRKKGEGRPERNQAQANGEQARGEGPGGREHRGHGPRGHHGKGPGGFGMKGYLEANKDRSITKAEFTTEALKRFDALDTNKDGQVTRDEMRANAERNRENRPERQRGAAPTAPATQAAPAAQR